MYKTNLDSSKDSLKNKISGLLDTYATFKWNGHDMWEEYNAFIINNKGSLKFYNGPSFSNTYATPQFSKTSHLTGVTFKTQEISFTIGVYGIAAANYRKLIYILDPLAIGDLIFNFDPNWMYRVKLSSIDTSSTRYIVGHYLDGNKSEPLYYTEIKLTFELQGDPVALSTKFLEYSSSIADDKKSCTFTTTGTSELRTPLQLSFTLTQANSVDVILTATARDTAAMSFSDLTLFNLSLKNLVNTYEYIISYDSSTGNITLQHGDDRKLISLLTTSTSGMRIVNGVEAISFMLPGNFEDGMNPKDIVLQLSVSATDTDTNPEIKNIKDSDDLPCIQAYARKNLI